MMKINALSVRLRHSEMYKKHVRYPAARYPYFPCPPLPIAPPAAHGVLPNALASLRHHHHLSLLRLPPFRAGIFHKAPLNSFLIPHTLQGTFHQPTLPALHSHPPDPDLHPALPIDTTPGRPSTPRIHCMDNPVEVCPTGM